ncbi:MAG: hypothetical protein A2166_03805 [Omnitrophica WOR_2 bacterium RBG_13_41_10]|nr:MAG: hypothetical protein A2166_03805 [Omnitrophica WOR_2 bacterium RBG_13_41_10]
MLTEKENKIIRNIVNGRMRRIRIYSSVFMATVFLILLVFSLNVKNKTSGILERTFGRSESSLMKIETKTKLEERLKSMLSESDNELKKMTYAVIVASITWRLIWFGTIFFMAILELWNLNIFERIINKLQEEREMRQV